MTDLKSKIKGLTLLEVLLVIAIISSIAIIAGNLLESALNNTKLNRAAVEMQQILDAGLSYYNNNGNWGTTGTTALPEVLASTSNLITQNYLPEVPSTPWGGAYSISQYSQNNVELFQVSVTMQTAAEAQLLASRLPMAQVTGTTVIAEETVPGMNLNNASAVNFGSIYNSGACVPAPQCPKGMTPQIVVTPTAVNGVYSNSGGPSCNDPTEGSSCASTTPSYPLTGYTATAIGDPNNPNLPMDISTGSIVNCSGNGADACAADETATNGSPQCPSGNQLFCDSESPQNCITTSAVMTGGICCPSTAGWAAYATSFCINFTNKNASPNQIYPWYVNPITATSSITSSPVALPSQGFYWRVCLKVVTSAGVVSPTFPAWGQLQGSILALTRCVPSGEPAGSGFNVYTQ